MRGQEKQHRMQLRDGTGVSYRIRVPVRPSDRALLLFRYGEGGADRWERLVRDPGCEDVRVITWSGRPEAENSSILIRDLESFVRGISRRHSIPPERMAVLAGGVGAAVAAIWAHDYAPPIGAMILAEPAFRVGRFSRHRLPGLRDGTARAIADAGGIRIPTLLLGAGAGRRFFEGLSSPKKEMLPGREGRLPVAETRRFLREVFEEPGPGPAADASPCEEYTRREHERFVRPLALLSPRGVYFALSRGFVRSVGRLSHGICLGWKTGFESGRMFDHVYLNRARGRLLIGKWIDRIYLDNAGWVGVRQRRANLRKLLRKYLDKLQAGHRPLTVLDIAAGPGRYLLETIRELSLPVTARIRDFVGADLAAGRRLAAEWNLSGLTFQQGDALDEDSLAAVEPRPNIAVAAGIYEQFADNESVLRSLRGLARAVPAGGYLLYTNQPWHPQLEWIGRVLVNRQGKPWAMRRRSQTEMDGLVERSGFRKLEMEIDEAGRFSVSAACRLG